MKKTLSFVIFLMALSQIAVAEMFEILSLGFNTRETIDSETGEMMREFYMLNNDMYSTAQMQEFTEAVNALYAAPIIGEDFRFQFSVDSKHVIIHPFTVNFIGAGYTWMFGTYSRGPVYVNFTDGILTLEHVDDSRRRTNPGREMNIYDTEIFYNIPAEEIEHMYLRLFVRYTQNLIDVFLNTASSFSLDYNQNYRILEDRNQTLWNDRQSWTPWGGTFIEYVLPNLTKHELAIMRNLLFARHNYAFQSVFWSNFMTTYYQEDYNGIYSESAAIEKFHWFETYLLDSLIEYENN